MRSHKKCTERKSEKEVLIVYLMRYTMKNGQKYNIIQPLTQYLQYYQHFHTLSSYKPFYMVSIFCGGAERWIWSCALKRGRTKREQNRCGPPPRTQMRYFWVYFLGFFLGGGFQGFFSVFFLIFLGGKKPFFSPSFGLLISSKPSIIFVTHAVFFSFNPEIRR